MINYNRLAYELKRDISNFSNKITAGVTVHSPAKSSSFVNNNTLTRCTQNAKTAFWRCNSPVFCDFRFATLTKNTSRLSLVNSNECDCHRDSPKILLWKNHENYSNIILESKSCLLEK